MASLTRQLEARHGVPALLSFFVPGLGQIIKGNVSTAIQAWIGMAVLVGVGLAGLWLTFIGIPILWIWSLYDAYVAPDGPTRRELERFTKTLVVLVACGLAGAGCGNVTALATDDGGAGGASGAAGRVGVESDAGGAGGSLSATGDAGPATGGSSGGALGAGGAHATGGTGGAVAGPGGNPGTGGIPCSGSLSLCNGGCVDLLANGTSCGSCGHGCAAGQLCTNGICAESCASWGWTPSGCTACPAGSKTGKPCSVCTNEPSWFTGSSACQEGDASSGFLAAASCSACLSF